MNQSLIVIDGRTYKSVEEMPEDVRRKYEQAMNSLKDTDGDRIPNTLENMNILADRDPDGVPGALEGLASMNVVSNVMKIIVDGKEYSRIEDLPPDARARYEEAMGKLDANRNGVPDFMEGMMNAPKQTTVMCARLLFDFVTVKARAAQSSPRKGAKAPRK